MLLWAWRGDERMKSMHRSLIWMGLLGALLFLPSCASGPPPTAMERGFAALARDEFELASGYFVEALRANPQNGEAWQGQAAAQVGALDPEAALRSLARLAQVDAARFSGEGKATYADALASATQKRNAQGQHQAALQAVRALVQLDPERRGLDRLLGQALLKEAERRARLGGQKEAHALYAEACQVVPQRLEAWVGAAEILLVSGKSKAAVRLLESARKYHPTAGSIRSLTLQAMRAR